MLTPEILLQIAKRIDSNKDTFICHAFSFNAEYNSYYWDIKDLMKECQVDFSGNFGFTDEEYNEKAKEQRVLFLIFLAEYLKES